MRGHAPSRNSDVSEGVAASAAARSPGVISNHSIHEGPTRAATNARNSIMTAGESAGGGSSASARPRIAWSRVAIVNSGRYPAKIQRSTRDSWYEAAAGPPPYAPPTDKNSNRGHVSMVRVGADGSRGADERPGGARSAAPGVFVRGVGGRLGLIRSRRGSPAARPGRWSTPRGPDQSD